MADYLLGLDAGNTVIKAALFDAADGRELAVVAQDGRASLPAPGHVERDLDELGRVERRLEDFGLADQRDARWKRHADLLREQQRRAAQIPLRLDEPDVGAPEVDLGLLPLRAGRGTR